DNVNIVNLTPHALNLVADSGTVTIPPSGTVARVSVTRESVGTVTVEGVTIPLYRSTYGKGTDLPPPSLNRPCVGSAGVAAAARDRGALVIPDELVRDSEGRITGARGLGFPA